MRTNLLIGLTAILAMLTGATTHYWMGSNSNVTPNDPPAMQAPLRDLNGLSRNISEWRGKVLVVNFWASWCAPCREEMPEFIRLQKEFGGRGLQFIGIAIDESEAVQDFLREFPVNYPILLGDEETIAWGGRLGNHAGVLPFSAVFDREGKLISSHLGVFRREQILEMIERLLEPHAATALQTSPNFRLLETKL
jgi:thiol-disulfide isomerase/thioredoxin